jgi:hypothetical protein
MTSLFQDLLERNISSEFFNNFLSVKELTKLQFSCKSIYAIIVTWKQNYELRLLKINYNAKYDSRTTEDNILKIGLYGHRSVYEIVVLSNIKLTAVGYHYLTLIQNIQVLRIEDITRDGLKMIASSFCSSLTTLSLTRLKDYGPSLSAFDFNLLTHLTNLKTLILDQVYYFSNEAGENFHKLNLQSFTLLGVPSVFSNIEEISFLSTLTTLTALTVSLCHLNDRNVRWICQNCILLEDLDIRNNLDVTPVGLSIENIQNLKNLHKIHFNFKSRICWKNLSVGWWIELTNLPSLNFIDLGGSSLSEEVWKYAEKMYHFNIDLTAEEDFYDLTAEEEYIEIEMYY